MDLHLYFLAACFRCDPVRKEAAGTLALPVMTAGRSVVANQCWFVCVVLAWFFSAWKQKLLTLGFHQYKTRGTNLKLCFFPPPPFSYFVFIYHSLLYLTLIVTSCTSKMPPTEAQSLQLGLKEGKQDLQTRAQHWQYQQIDGVQCSSPSCFF